MTKNSFLLIHNKGKRVAIFLTDAHTESKLLRHLFNKITLFVVVVLLNYYAKKFFPLSASSVIL